MRDGLLPRMEARPWASDPTKFTYRYHPVGGKPITLGTDRDAAIRRVLDMNKQSPHHGTLLWVWEQWQTHKRYLRLSEGTRVDYALAWKQIDKKFGKRQAGSIKTTEIARYVHLDRADSPRRADLEKTVMSNLFKHAILLGVSEQNPTIGVEPHGSEPRAAGSMMPQTAALTAFLKWINKQSLQRRRIGFMARYASLAGNRRCEFLTLTKPQVDLEAGVIRTFRAKQRGAKKHTVVEVVKITPALRALLDEIYATIPEDCLYLFPTEDGNAYTDKGWKTLWQRCMIDAIEHNVITKQQRFTFHMLRHYYVTMHRAVHGERPDLHANPAVTATIYDETTEVKRTAL